MSPAVAGATFEIERRTNTALIIWWLGWTSYTNVGTVTDCTAAPCPPTGDLDPDPGEFQIAYAGGERIVNDTNRLRTQYRVTPTDSPAGYSWTDTTPKETAQPDAANGIDDLGTFALGTNPAAVCTSGTFYSLSTTGVVNQVTLRNGQSPSINAFGQFPGVGSNAQMNAFGIGLGGTVMYAAERSSGSANGVTAIHRYSVADGWQRMPQTGVATGTGVVLGAVSLLDGRYYFGGFSAGGGSTTFQLYVYDPATNSVSSRGTFAASMNGTSNGDLAFDLLGNLYVVQNLSGGDTRIYTITAAAVAAGGTMPASSTPGFSGLSGTNGVAFEGDGTIYLGSGTTVRIYDPSTGALRSGSVTTSLVDSGDLASCLSPATLTVRKDVVGRVTNSDQFTLSVQRGSSTIGSATTSGTATGVQAAQVGPVTALAGQTYTILETISANAGSYTSSYACVDERGAAVASGSARTGSVTMPNRSGANVVCTFRNAPLVTSVVVRKLVEDAAGTQSPASGWTLGSQPQATTGTVTATPSATTQTSDAQGEARWSLRFGTAASRASIAVSETQRSGYAFVEGECVIVDAAGAVTSVTMTSAQGTTLTGIAAGAAVDCTFVNRLLPTTLTLVKSVPFGTVAPTTWPLRASGPQSARPGPAGITGSAQATAQITPGVAYRLSESGGPATYVQTGAWRCIDELGAELTVSASNDLTVARSGASVTCTVTNQTARLTLLKSVVNDNGGTIRADQFALTATPVSLAGLSARTVAGASTVSSANTMDVRPGHAYAISENMGAYAYLGQSIQRYTGPANPTVAQLAAATNWQTITAAQAAAVTVPAGQHAFYRFVNDDAPALALPLTGGIGSDSYLVGGGALLFLAAAFLLVRHARRRQDAPQTDLGHLDPQQPLASPQEGNASMATNKKGLTARLAAGFGAAAIATVAIVGGATPAFAAANIDFSAPASITIHMHEQTGTAGTVGTGSPSDPVAGPGIEGVEFSIRAVTNLDVRDNSTWATLATPLTADDVIGNTAYPLGATEGTNAWTVTTGVGGAVMQSVPQGVYLVQQQAAPASAGVVIRSKPFLVVVPQAVEATSTWNYNVHVYPKTSISDVTKDLEAFEQEGLGSNLTWDLDVAVPVASQGRKLTSFGIVDSLDPRLSHSLATAGAVRVTVGTTTLTRGTDFSVALSGQSLSIDFLEPGIDALVANPDQRVAVEIDTTITRLDNGTIDNVATVSVNGTQITSNTATGYFGGIELQKNDDQGAPLQGAVFEVLDADGDVVTINNVSEFSSDVNGVVTIAGLRTNAAGTELYTIREKSAPAGYQLGSTTTWDIEVPVGTNAAVEETVVNAQIPAYALPITGGSGQAAFMIGGAGLLAGALGFMLIRRRKADAEA